MFERATPYTAAVLVLLTAGCGGGAASGTAMVERDSAGIRIVEHPASGAAERVAEADLSIGLAEGQPEYVFGRLTGLAVSADGRIVVLDSQARELRVFSATGRALARLGGAGAGPSELQQPMLFWLDGEDVVVHDAGNRKLVRYTLAGDFVETRPLGVAPGSPIGGWFEPAAGRRFVATNVMGCLTPGDHETEWTRVLTDEAGRVLDTLEVRVGGATAMVFAERMCTPVALPFGSDPHLERGPAGVWAVGDGRSYEIRIGRIRESRAAEDAESAEGLHGWFEETLRIRRRHEARAVTADERRAHRDAVLAATPESRRGALEVGLRGLEAPPSWPAWFRIRFDDDGRLWVLRTPNRLAPPAPGEASSPQPRRYNVYAPDGRLLFEVVLPAAMLAARGAHVYMTSVDDALGHPVVLRYRLPEHEPGAGPGTASPAPASAPADTLPPADWHAIDHGRGVLHFREPAGGGVRTDTMVLLDARGGGLAGRFLRVQTEHGSWLYIVEQIRGDAVSANVLEYAYEESGLPLERLDEGGGWAEVVYGLDATGAGRTAWVRLGPALAWELWEETLPAQSLFFRAGVTPSLHASPGGPALAFDFPGDDYALEADSVAGEWLRVRVTTPHPCSGDPPAREAVGWVRHLDGATGRPRVWYYSRGC
jgi:hypothetical protein